MLHLAPGTVDLLVHFAARVGLLIRMGDPEAGIVAPQTGQVLGLGTPPDARNSNS